MRPLVMVVVAIVAAGCSGPSGGNEPGDATTEQGLVQGVVVDEAIRPLAGVVVRLTDVQQEVVTADDGAFRFVDLAPGAYVIEADKARFTSVQTRVDVTVGDAAVPIVRITLLAVPTQLPFVESHVLNGYLSMGLALGATSIGTTAYAPLAEAMGDRSIWTLQFTQLPSWSQGELVWDQTQPAGGEFVWEITNTTNAPAGYSESAASPALAYWNTTVLRERTESTLDPQRGIAYRFFGGAHPLAKPADLCPSLPVTGNPCIYGYGLTVQQKADAYIHNFYNFVPPEGWRYTVDGDPVVPR